MKIVAVADSHVGGERFGATPEEWDGPLHEAVEYAVANKAQLFVVAGDLFHKRNPTTAEYSRALAALDRLEYYGIECLVVDGNHDVGASAESIAATWPLALAHVDVARGAASVRQIGGFEVIALPWPRPVDYIAEDDLWSLVDVISSTREAVFKRLRELCDAPTDRPRILVGHAMVSYGTVTPDDPGLMLGKDIVLPYEQLSALPGVEAILLGHVHNPDAEGYVGSTQPTDFGEATQVKSFTVLDIEAGQVHRQQVPYKTSLKLLNLDVTDEQFVEFAKTSGKYDGFYDAARVKVTLPAPESHLYADAVRSTVARVAKRVLSVELVRPQLAKRRLDLAEAPIVSLAPDAAFARWMKAREIPDATAAQVLGVFKGMAEPAAVPVA